MYGKIAIPRMKPDGLPELPHVLQAEERIPFYPPAALATQQSGQYVGDRIDVGRNVQTPPQQVIARIDDERELLRGHYSAQTVDKFCPARSPVRTVITRPSGNSRAYPRRRARDRLPVRDGLQPLARIPDKPADAVQE